MKTDRFNSEIIYNDNICDYTQHDTVDVCVYVWEAENNSILSYNQIFVDTKY